MALTVVILAYMLDDTVIQLSGIMQNLMPVSIDNAIGGAVWLAFHHKS